MGITFKCRKPYAYPDVAFAGVTNGKIDVPTIPNLSTNILIRKAPSIFKYTLRSISIDIMQLIHWHNIDCYFFSFYGIMELGIFNLSFIEHSESPLTKAYFAHTKQVLSCIIREIINQVIASLLIEDENYHTIFTFWF